MIKIAGVIKPEIYAVVPQSGQLTIKPEIYATVYRPPKEETISGDTLVRGIVPNEIKGDTLIRGSKLETVTGDTLIKPKIAIATADTKLVIVRTETAAGDTYREVKRTERIIGDAVIRNAKVETAAGDTLRAVIGQAKAVADTLIRYPHELEYTATRNTFGEYGLTSFSVILRERTLSDNFQVETVFPLGINDAIRGKFLDYEFSFLVESTSQRELVQTAKGMYDIDKMLYTQIYSSGTVTYYRNGDTETEGLAISEGRIIYQDDSEVIYAYARASDFVGRVAGYLGLAAEIRIDDYTPYNLIGSSNITYLDLISALFGWTSKLPQRQINVFVRGRTLYCIQRGKEERVIDITHLPHKRPQVDRKLIRSLWNNPIGTATSGGDKGDSGYEDYGEEEVAVPFSGVIRFEDEGVSTSRTYKNGLLKQEDITTRNNKINVTSVTEYEYREIYDDGASNFSVFVHGLTGDIYLSRKTTKATTYQYGEDNKKIESTGTTEYRYVRTEGNDLYLSEEYETTEIKEYAEGQLGWEVDEDRTQIRQTFHSPIGNGWYGTSVYVDGEPQGSSVSQGKPGNKVSLYTVNQAQATFSQNRTTATAGGSGGSGGSDYEDWRKRLSPIADTSFPVRELDMLKELTEELLWLNRKVQEEVRVEIVDRIRNGVPTLNHVIDFTERIRLNGAEYYLVSNEVRMTPRSLIQKLQLVRWY